MPTENDKPSSAGLAPDPRDAEIAGLKQQVTDLEKKLKAKVAGPAGSYCVLDGKTYQVERTVTAKFATDEARKGFIDMDAELVVLKR